jgi:threonine/homoserine/homoserine lactone efflux protein
MDLARLVAFGAIALVVIAIPGPSVLFIVSRAVSLGRGGALVTVLGNAGGEFIQVLVVAVGMGQLLERSALAFSAVRLVGAAYLCYLGVQAWRGRRSAAAALGATTSPRGPVRLLRDGLIVGVSNPKSMVFFAAVLPEFVERARGHTVVQLLLLGLVWVAIALVSDSTWALVAGTARSWLVGRPARLRQAQGASAIVMVGLGVGLAVSSRAS